MPSTKDINKETGLKILLYSENGFGKSIAAGSFYKAGPIRVWDFDGRMKPLSTYYPGVDINYDTFDSDNFRQFLDELETLQDKCPWKTIVLDSVTSASNACVVYQLKMKDKLKTTKGGLPATSWDEINGETVLFTKALEACKLIHRKFNTHIIWTCHPVAKTIITDEGSKRITSLVAYGNKIPSIIPGYFDEIYSFTLDKVGIDSFKRVVNTVPKNDFPGKTAMKLPNSFDITNKNFYDELMSLINKGENMTNK